MNSPEFIYRLDERSPDEIFQKGFRSWGGDKDVARHLMGVSTRNRTSAYIATTEDQPYLLDRFAKIFGMAQRRLRGVAPERLYVYKIRFQPNCKRVADLPNSPSLPRETEGFVERQREFLAIFQIFPQDVLEAQVLLRCGDKYVVDDIVPNVIRGESRRNSAAF